MEIRDGTESKVSIKPEPGESSGWELLSTQGEVVEARKDSVCIGNTVISEDLVESPETLQTQIRMIQFPTWSHSR